jgi:hypothetical protein
MPTTSSSLSILASHSAFSAPAVKVVWLPPPWQAIAILSLDIASPQFSAEPPHVTAARRRCSKPRTPIKGL